MVCARSGTTIFRITYGDCIIKIEKDRAASIFFAEIDDTKPDNAIGAVRKSVDTKNCARTQAE
jgi:hypothetical protein